MLLIPYLILRKIRRAGRPLPGCAGLIRPYTVEKAGFNKFIHYTSIPAVSQWHFRRNLRIPAKSQAFAPGGGEKGKPMAEAGGKRRLPRKIITGARRPLQTDGRPLRVFDCQARILGDCWIYPRSVRGRAAISQKWCSCSEQARKISRQWASRSGET